MHPLLRVAAYVDRGMQLSFYVKRWCTTGTSSFTAAGIDNYAYQTSNFAYGFEGSRRLHTRMCAGHVSHSARMVGVPQYSLSAASSIVCGANAACTGATCVCQTNYYGSGLSCARTCPRNVPANLTRPCSLIPTPIPFPLERDSGRVHRQRRIWLLL